MFAAAWLGVTSVQSYVDFNVFKKCSRVTLEAYCKTSWGAAANRDTLDVAVRCNSTQWARYVANQCSRDGDSGAYCGEATVYLQDIYRILSDCAQPIANKSASCSSECARRLETIRNDLGCCINAILNDTDGIFTFSLPVFTYSLWKNCGVAPISSVCELSDVFQAPYFQTVLQSTASNCSFDELQSKILAVTCAHSEMILFTAALTKEVDCDDYIQFYQDSCSLDAKGKFCLAIPTEGADIINFITPIVKNCNSTTSCSFNCKTSLDRFQSSRGCCVNAIYNSTFAEVMGLNSTTFQILADNHLFKLCGVSLPPLNCNVPTT